MVTLTQIKSLFPECENHYQSRRRQLFSMNTVVNNSTFEIIVSYTTIVMIYDIAANTLYINPTKYSATTTRHINYTIKLYGDTVKIVQDEKDFSIVLNKLRKGSHE